MATPSNAAASVEAYTGTEDSFATPDLLMSPPIDQKTVLRGLTVGFGLVILLLAAAAYIAVSRSRSIQTTAAELVQRHLLTTQLVDNLQLNQQRLSTLLFDLLDKERPVTRERIDKLEQDIRDATAAGNAAVTHGAWNHLATVGAEFGTSARQLLDAARESEREKIGDRLEQLRSDFTELSSELVRAQGSDAVRLETLIEQQSRDLTGEAIGLIGACLLLSIAGAALTIQVTQRSFRLMKWQADELSRVSWNMLQSQEAAARRFSHEMHDELGQSLTGLKAMLVGVRPDEFAARRPGCVHLLDEAISNVRELSQLLHPVILDDFGLSAGLRWLAERFAERTRIEVDCVADFGERLDDEIETHLFRITQEALTNIARHSGANRARIWLRADRDRIHLTIEDDGKGLPAENQSHPTLGMVGMRARARQVGGELTVTAVRPHGVKIEVRVPRRNPSYAAEKDARTAG